MKDGIDAELSRVRSARNDMFEELTRLRAREAVLVGIVTEFLACNDESGSGLKDDDTDGDTGFIAFASPRLNAIIERARKALATLDVEEKM